MPNSDLEILLCLTPDDFTLSNTRQFYSSKWETFGTKGLRIHQFQPVALILTTKLNILLTSFFQAIDNTSSFHNLIEN